VYVHFVGVLKMKLLRLLEKKLKRMKNGPIRKLDKRRSIKNND